MSEFDTPAECGRGALRACPKCGEEFHQLPNHLPTCEE